MMTCRMGSTKTSKARDCFTSEHKKGYGWGLYRSDVTNDLNHLR